MGIAHVFFDLDGTLVDSFPGISFSAQAALARVCPNRLAPDFLPFIGPPIREVFRRALSEPDPRVLDCLEQAFRASYDSVGLKQTRAYPGVKQVLATLREFGLTCRVLTNKPKWPTQEILQHLGLDAFFAEVITPDCRAPGFTSKVQAALDARLRHSLSGAEGLVVGDSTDDGAAAEACGFQFAAVTFGYGLAHRDHLVPVHHRLERFEDLLSVALPSYPSGITESSIGTHHS